jgi:probable HAF family extracellular repeat protein
MPTRSLLKLGAALGATALATTVLMASSVAAETPDRDDRSSEHFAFHSVSFPTDPRFTQLLGINDHQLIAGYHGDENTEMTPNKGFTLQLPSSFTDENFPNSAQTQVIGINNDGDTVGFYVDQAGTTHGFLKDKGKDAVTVDLPGTTFNQLLGINNKGQAAGYYQDQQNPPLQHAYIHEKNGDFRVLGNLPMPSSQATGINDKGDIVGFLQQSTADTKSSGFLLKANGKLEALNVEGSTFTQALGINDNDEVVGLYQDANGVQHGFLYEDGHFEKIDVPGSASTVANGLNKHEQIVGFFTDKNGNTVGFEADPKS